MKDKYQFLSILRLLNMIEKTEDATIGNFCLREGLRVEGEI
jgi:hypothetical protein